MFVLISNDDGIHADGIRVLEDAVRDVFADVAVVAPSSQRSGVSHALSLNRPIPCRMEGPARYSLDGSPADCVFLAVHHLLPRTPDLVVSGINAGPNLGYDTVYSGTVAAAREGLMNGISSIAFSLAATRHFDFEHCREVVGQVLRAFAEEPPAEPAMLNVNIPAAADFPRLAGFRCCSLGTRVFANTTEEWTDPRGNRYLWLGGADLDMKGDEDADTRWIGQGYVTFTPLTWNLYRPAGRGVAEALARRLESRQPRAGEVHGWGTRP